VSYPQKDLSEDTNLYQDAGGAKAQPEVQQAVERYRSLPPEERARLPLLYWLLGAGTPPYKMSGKDSEYVDQTANPKETCDNCEYAYKAIDGTFICSKIRPRVEPKGWCRLWDPARKLVKF
jgi:hypothetical protein